MLWRSVAVAVAAALAAVAWTGSARADGDTIRLGLNVAAPTMTLEGGKDADTVDVWRRYGGYSYYRPSYYGGYGGYSSYYRPYYGGYYGGGYSSYYRPYYGGYYGGGYSSYYRPYYGGYYGGGYSSYYRPYYGGYYGGYSYYQPYYGISLDGSCGTQVLTLPANPGKVLAPQTAPPAVRDGTFPYDGGPDRPVPMPKVESESEGTRIPKQTTPMIEGIPVSLKAKPKYVYPAYGEKR